MDNMSFDEIREERFWDVISDMDAEETLQYALDFIFSYDEVGRKFIAEFLADYDNEDDNDEEEDREEDY